MEFTGLGTAIMVAAAAVLWFAYLLPTWFRRREYLATERNATRLQQTLRIMAETAEVPDAVRVEATARDAAAQARVLAEHHKRRQAEERAAIAAVRRAAAPVLTKAEQAHRRLVRARRIAALSLLAAVIIAAVQGVMMLTTGAVAASWWVLAGAGALGFVSVNSLRGLAGRARPSRVAEAKPAPQRETASPARRALVEEAGIAEPVRAWTPVPVPKPLYLSRPAPQPVSPPRDADRLMREASAAAHAALRAAHGEAEVVAMPSRTAPAASTATAPAASTASAPAASAPATSASASAPQRPAEPSRWARMGLVGDVESAVPDLDEVLRRRRAAS